MCWRIGIFLLSGDLSFRAESLETHGSKGIFFLDLMSSKRGFATLFVLVVLSIFLRRQIKATTCVPIKIELSRRASLLVCWWCLVLCAPARQRSCRERIAAQPKSVAFDFSRVEPSAMRALDMAWRAFVAASALVSLTSKQHAPLPLLPRVGRVSF